MKTFHKHIPRKTSNPSEGPFFVRLRGREESSGFTLIELMVVIAILGTLSSLAYLVPPVMDQEDLHLARQIADQVEVALSNAQLMEQFEDLSWGTLLSLACAVDTKSAWTGGHSERVTELALTIGRELGLDRTDLLNLHRGGLLHDVGKIGISSNILDKPGKLTREGCEIIKQHPRLGVRILEPIKNYGSVICFKNQKHIAWTKRLSETTGRSGGGRPGLKEKPCIPV